MQGIKQYHTTGQINPVITVITIYLFPFHKCSQSLEELGIIELAVEKWPLNSVSPWNIQIPSIAEQQVHKTLFFNSQ